MTSRINATLVQNMCQLPPGPFRISGSTKLSLSSFRIHVAAKMTPSPCGSHGCSVKRSNLATSGGKQTLDDVTAFLVALECHFNNAAQAIRWVGTTGCGEQAVLQLQGDTAVRAVHHFPITAPIGWSTLCTEWSAKYIPSNSMDHVK